VNRPGDRREAESGGQRWTRENRESFAGAPAAVKAMVAAAIENLRDRRSIVARERERERAQGIWV
jgi:hypothetical protein